MAAEIGGRTPRGIARRPGPARRIGRPTGRHRPGGPPGARGDRPRRRTPWPTTTSRPRSPGAAEAGRATRRWSHLLPAVITDAGSIVIFGGQAQDRPYPGSTTVSPSTAASTAWSTPSPPSSPRSGSTRSTPASSGTARLGGQDRWTQVIAQTPLGRLATMAELLTRSNSCYEIGSVNGECLTVNGGRYLR